MASNPNRPKATPYIPTRPPSAPWDVIAAAIVGGTMTMREASARFDIPLGTIQARSARKRWFNRPQPAPKTPPAEPAREQLPPDVLKTAMTKNPRRALHNPPAAEDAEDQSPDAAQEQIPAPRAPIIPAIPAEPVKTRRVITAEEVIHGIAEQIEENKAHFRGSMSRTARKVAEAVEKMPEEAVFEKADKLAALARAGTSVFGEEGGGKAGGGLVVSIAFLRGEVPEEGDTIDVAAEVVPR